MRYPVGLHVPHEQSGLKKRLRYKFSEYCVLNQNKQKNSNLKTSKVHSILFLVLNEHNKLLKMEKRICISENPPESMEETKKCLKVKYTLKVSIIPEEIWIYIFDFFDFRILQRVLTLVCREWFQIIRQTLKFSGQLNVVPGTQLSDINSMLNSWKVSVTSVVEFCCQAE